MRGKGEGSIFKDGRGLWTAVVELPPRNGARRRKTIRSKDKRIVVTKLRDLQQELERSGDLPTKDLTVGQWMDEWFTTIALLKIRPKTANTYRGLIAREIVPAIGTTKLDKLMPGDVRRMLAATIAKGLSSTTAMQVHRILAVALKAAERDGKVRRNVALLVDAPRPARKEMRALTVDEALAVLETASTDPLGSLWASILLTGARQGELLGLQRDRVGDMIELSWQLQRLTWEHGCTDFCGRKRGADCKYRKMTFPPDYENQHLTGGLWLSRPKSLAGWRIVPLVEPLRTILLRHIDATEPGAHNLVWTINGNPIDPRVESQLWHDLLKRAGVTDVNVHAGRHTTADLLYLAGVPEDVISEILGHSVRAVTRGYKSKGNQARLTDAMNKVTMLLTTPTGERSDTPGAIAS
jgi:integrase